MGAEPGTFVITIKDPDRSLSFVTGREVTLDIDGHRQFGGYITHVGMGHFFDADDTSEMPDYTKRKWMLRGPDYNIIFDKRVVRNTNDYTQSINLTDQTDGALLRRIINDYADMDDYTHVAVSRTSPRSMVTSSSRPARSASSSRSTRTSVGRCGTRAPARTSSTCHSRTSRSAGASPTPPTTTRSPPARMSSRARPSVSDRRGGRRRHPMVNDAIDLGRVRVGWQRGQWCSLARPHAGSIAEHNRWQLAETHFGERCYKIQDGVDRAGQRHRQRSSRDRP